MSNVEVLIVVSSDHWSIPRMFLPRRYCLPRHGLQSGDYRNYPVLYGVLCIFTFCVAALQFVLINMGLQRFDGTLFYPM